MPAVDTGLSAVQDAAATALVTLDMPHRRGSGFVAASGGLLLTNLHLVAGSEELSARLADGRLLRVEQVVAFDEKHDLAVLLLPEPGLAPLRLEAYPLPAEGAPLSIHHLEPTGALRVLETRVREVRVLDESFTFLELEGALLPPPQPPPPHPPPLPPPPQPRRRES